MELTANEVWQGILVEAESALPETAFRTWLAPTEAVAISQDLLVVSTPNRFAVNWVEDKYADMLCSIGHRLFGRRFTLSVQLHGKGTAELPPAAQLQQAGPAPGATQVDGNDAPRQPAGLNDRYTFERFVVGNNNQLAAAAAHAVAESPARMYNPLFVYGGVGLGKTHLMQAIGHASFLRNPNARVAYISSEKFTNELVAAIQAGEMAEFRQLYRAIDLLLVDDIQFLEGKERTQEEFFHTFNALHDEQRQIVVTSDRPPKRIGLEDRLISRFEWGLVADIKPPDFETRMAILHNKVEEDGLEIDDEEGVLAFLAQHCTSSVRELEGAVIKLLAFSSLHHRKITLELARESLGAMFPDGTSRADGDASLTPERVRREVANAFGVGEEGLQSKKRTKSLTMPRQVAMYLIKETFDLSLVEIGKLFGGRDHSTVIHSINRMETEIGSNSELRARVDEIRAGLP